MKFLMEHHHYLLPVWLALSFTNCCGTSLKNTVGTGVAGHYDQDRQGHHVQEHKRSTNRTEICWQNTHGDEPNKLLLFIRYPYQNYTNKNCASIKFPEIMVTQQTGVAGIRKALDIANSMRRAYYNLIEGPISVVLESGDYFASTPLVLEVGDSGDKRHPTIIRPARNQTPRIVGSLTLTAVATSRREWEFLLDCGNEQCGVQGGDFYINNKRATLSRYPKKPEFNYVDALVDKSQQANATMFTSFRVRDSDFIKLRDIIGSEEHSAVLFVMQSWTHSEHQIVELNDDKILVLKQAAKWPFLYFGSQQRYAIINSSKAFSEPGEWYIRKGVIHYKPIDGYKTGDVDARFSSSETLLIIRGSTDAPVHDIRISGINFSFTGKPFGPYGITDIQAGVKLRAALEIDYAENIEISDCVIRNIGGYAVWLNRQVTDSRVINNIFEDLGGGGIKVGTEQVDGGARTTARNRLAGNTIRDIGLRYPGSVAIWVGQSNNNEISNNLITKTTYSGISVGWTWGYGNGSAYSNKITRNTLTEIGQATLADLGAIYSLGGTVGTEITENFVRDVHGFSKYGAGAWGIYNDEGTNGIIVKDNVVLFTDDGGYHLHYGAANSVIHNIFFGSERGSEVSWGNVPRSGAWNFSGNIVHPLRGEKFDFLQRAKGFDFGPLFNIDDSGDDLRLIACLKNWYLGCAERWGGLQAVVWDSVISRGQAMLKNGSKRERNADRLDPIHAK